MGATRKTKIPQLERLVCISTDAQACLDRCHFWTAAIFTPWGSLSVVFEYRKAIESAFELGV